MAKKVKVVKTPPGLYCSFCGKFQGEVEKIIAGPGVCICNECVDLCKDILAAEKKPKTKKKKAKKK